MWIRGPPWYPSSPPPEHFIHSIYGDEWGRLGTIGDDLPFGIHHDPSSARVAPPPQDLVYMLPLERETMFVAQALKVHPYLSRNLTPFFPFPKTIKRTGSHAFW